MNDDEASVRRDFAAAGLSNIDINVHRFEGEVVYRLLVPAESLEVAKQVASALEERLTTADISSIIVVRPLKVERVAQDPGPVRNLDDNRILALTQLLSSRSRTSEAQPSLSYIPNNTGNLALVTGARHHLVFGRRGAGKTALLLEARRTMDAQGSVTAWVNMQPWRHQSKERAFLGIQRVVIGQLISAAQSRGALESSQSLARLHNMKDRIEALLREDFSQAQAVDRLLPDLQATTRQATVAMGCATYVFLDDFYYIPRTKQADLLDMLHSSMRDADAWLKVASIRHLTRWFRPYPPVGLQTGQDADLIDLDLSLQDPAGAVDFLQRMFLAYCGHVDITKLTAVLSRDAFERLVFASGGVPRDFLNLAAGAISRAKTRTSARTVGVSDVNQAAGDAARSKTAELEDDLASNIGFAPQAYKALNRVRDFCMDERSFTYFRVDFRDRDRNGDSHAILTRLLEARLIHLIDASVSDRDRAGERSECYTLDLSQYSGSRLKQGLRVLDLHDGKLVSKQTRVQGPEYIGENARQILTILRGAPLLPLARFKDLVAAYEPAIDDIVTVLGHRRSATLDEIAIAVGRSYEDVATELAGMVEDGRVGVLEEGGAKAYRWLN